MQYRELGRTGWKVSAVSMGCWAIGGAWGPVDRREFMAALRRAVELGVNFFDTADIYGESEQFLAKLRREVKEEIYIATKIGRRLNPHVASGYNRENLTAFVDAALGTWKWRLWTWYSSTARPPRLTTCPRCSRSWTTW